MTTLNQQADSDLLIGSVYSRTNMVAARETAGCSSASVPHRGVTVVGLVAAVYSCPTSFRLFYS